MTCTKRHVTFVWALFECLLFTGLIFGWPWFLSTLRRNRYFLDLCNVTLPEEQAFPESDSEDSLLKPGGIHDFDGSKQQKIRCRPRTTTPATTVNPLPYHDFMSNYTYFCDDQEEHLEIVYGMVYLIRNALVFPMGFFLDMYGTTRTRLLTM